MKNKESIITKLAVGLFIIIMFVNYFIITLNNYLYVSSLGIVVILLLVIIYYQKKERK